MAFQLSPCNVNSAPSLVVGTADVNFSTAIAIDIGTGHARTFTAIFKVEQGSL